MSCKTALNTGSGCNGRCSECNGTRVAAEKAREISLLIPEKDLAPVSEFDQFAKHPMKLKD